MKIKLTGSVNTALEAGQLMLLRTIGHDRISILDIAITDNGKSDEIGTTRTINLRYRLLVDTGLAIIPKTTAEVSVNLKKEENFWDIGKGNSVFFELSNTCCDFDWIGEAKMPVLTRSYSSTTKP